MDMRYSVHRINYYEDRVTGSVWKETGEDSSFKRRMIGCRFVGRAAEMVNLIHYKSKILVTEGEIEHCSPNNNEWERLIIRDFQIL